MLTGPGADVVRLSMLDEAERERRFRVLQERMPAVWSSVRQGHRDESVVVLPSTSTDQARGRSGSLAQAFEERLLFLLLLLRQPDLRMVYVSSLPIAPAVIEYYLALLPGVIPSHALARLTQISADDGSARPLSEKLLDRPRLLERVRAAIPNRDRCHLIPYNTSTLERDVALLLDIPVFGADPGLAPLGTKSGCRRLFGEEGIVHPLGREGLHTVGEVVEALLELLDQRGFDEAVIKTDEGVSGVGNALIDLRGLGALPPEARRREVRRRVEGLCPEAGIAARTYLDAFAAGGGIVEERIVGERLESPSVQLRVMPGGSVELLSTHDQLLGGPSGQSYLGCVFPADPAYAALISGPAAVLAERLAREGVLGRFAVDFVVTQDADGVWHSYAIELNLRKGGTTHPFLTLQYLTGGSYDAASGRFLSETGVPKHLVATDHLEGDDLRALAVQDLFDVVARHHLHFDLGRQTGIVFHMISALTEHGRLGMTAVADSAEEAMALYQQATAVLLREAAAARQELAVPG
jgi:hypothetical protein